MVVKEPIEVPIMDSMLLLLETEDVNDESVLPLKRFADTFNMQVHLTYINKVDMEPNEEIEKVLEIFAKKQGFRNYHVESLSSSGGGKPEMINDYLDRFDIPFLAILSNKVSNFTRLMIGSDTKEVIEKVDVPVLSVTE